MSLVGGTRRCQRYCLKARTAGGRREKSTQSQRDIAENGSQEAPTALKAKRKPVTHPAERQKAVEEMQKQQRRPASPARTGPAQIHHAPRPFTHRSAASKRFPVGRLRDFSARWVDSEASRSSRCTNPPPAARLFYFLFISERQLDASRRVAALEPGSWVSDDHYPHFAL